MGTGASCARCGQGAYTVDVRLTSRDGSRNRIVRLRDFCKPCLLALFSPWREPNERI
jgi:hypothetical protein